MIDVVKNFKVNNTGTENASPKIQKAIAALIESGGGTLFFPAGKYLLQGTDEQNNGEAINGISVPFTGYSIEGACKSVNLIGEGRDTVLEAGCANMYVVRFSNSHSTMSGFQIKGNETSIGLAVVPELVEAPMKPGDKADQSHNVFRELFIHNCKDGVWLKAASNNHACYYNAFQNIHVVFQQHAIKGNRGRGVYIGGGAATNRNSFVQCMFGRLNTGVQIHNSDTNTFFGCSFEDIGKGENTEGEEPFPNNPPTAILVEGPVSNGNRFFGCTAEACDHPFRSIDNGGSEFYGCSFLTPENTRMNLIEEMESVRFCIGGGSSQYIPVNIESALKYQYDNSILNEAVRIGSWVIQEEEGLLHPTLNEQGYHAEGRLKFFNVNTRREWSITGYFQHPSE